MKFLGELVQVNTIKVGDYILVGYSPQMVKVAEVSHGKGYSRITGDHCKFSMGRLGHELVVKVIDVDGLEETEATVNEGTLVVTADPDSGEPVLDKEGKIE